MKWSIVRLCVSIMMGGMVSLGLNALNYKRYWQSTLQNIQTVEFNLLSHSLPTKLSALLIKGDREEIQNAINSHYGLVKIIVTDCTQETVNCLGQNILYLSKSKQQQTNSSSVTMTDLQNQPFNLLRNPPPLQTEWIFENPNTTEPTYLTANNRGKIIGRVYYLKNQSPVLSRDIKRYSDNFSANNLLSIYIITFGLSIISSLSLGLFIEQMIRNSKDKQKAIEDKKVAAKDLSNIRYKYKKSMERTDMIIQDYQKQLEESQQLHQQLTIKRLELERHKQSLSQAQELLKNTEVDAKIQQKELELELEKIQAELDNISTSEELARIENERLGQELEHHGLEKEKLNDRVIELNQTIAELQRSSREKVKAEVEKVHQKYEDYEDYFDEIAQENQELEKEIKQLRLTQDYYEDYEDYFDEIAQENQELEQKIDQLLLTQDYYEQKIDQLKSKILYWKYQVPQTVDSSDTESQYIDMSFYKFAIVSGHQNTVQNIQKSLIETNNVDPNNIIWIKDKKLGHNIRSKISHVDFVIVLTDYGGHQETRDAINLTKAGNIDAHLIIVPKGWHNGERIRQFIEQEVMTVK